MIATDKTGTLTEGRMDVRSLDVPDVPRALAAIVLVNDADLATGVGDPLDLGLLRYAAANGVDSASCGRTIRSQQSGLSTAPGSSPVSQCGGRAAL